MSWTGMDYDDRNDQFHRALNCVRDDITQAVNSFCAGTNTAMLPWVSYATGTGRKAYEEVPNAIHDQMAGKKLMAAFVEVLRKSECPHVAEFKKVFVDEYLESWGDELAEWLVTE